MSMNDGLVGRVPVYLNVDTVLAGCVCWDGSFKRDKDQFVDIIQVITGPLDVKALIAFTDTDITEVAPYKMFGKEPFSDPLEFAYRHRVPLLIWYYYQG
jgi:hypothetical protein